MIKGIYSAASAMIARLNQEQILAHNAANMDTPGFKQIMSTMEEFMQTPVISPPDGASVTNTASYIGNLGLGVETAPSTSDFTEGTLVSTGSPYDMAISGPGFFRINTPDGERLTRDGRFIRDASGQLTTPAGYQVLDKNGQPIKLPEGDLSVAADGTLTVNGKAAGQLGLVAYTHPDQELARDQDNTFLASTAPSSATVGTVQQAYLESSNVNPSQLMTQMTTVLRSYEAAQQMVQIQDSLLGETVSRLGKLG